MRYVIREKGKFLYGEYDAERALAAAKDCALFSEDSEEECVSDEPLSCFNCRYRRWTQESFVCMKGVIDT
jgi:hypothetical protein